ncbi:hypothetical protein [Gordonia sp. NPDC058843]|uniref:hypothetical protein n=1 Tax=Gordonia sp. NPDC058843 TaxID=3346648 RepID=UPI003694FDF5
MPASDLPRLNPQLTLRWIDTADLRTAQWGLITSGQGARFEMTATDLKRLRQNRYLVPVAHAVMCEPDRVGDGVLESARLAWVAAGKELFPGERLAAAWPDYVVTGTTALALHELADPIGPQPQLAVIRTNSARRYSSSTAELLAVDVPPSWDEVTLLDGLPVATPAAAIAALAATEPTLVDDLTEYLSDVAAASADRPDHDLIVRAIARATS